jgi:hypothetical protein
MKPANMFCNDSLINLRMTRKRPQRMVPSANTTFPKKSISMDDFQTKVAKRQRLNSTEGKKSVRFETLENKVYHRHLSEEDLGKAWMSEKESDEVKQNVYRTVLNFRRGRLDHQEDCIRGLEVHVNPTMMKKKMQSGKTFVHLILRQQTFLRGVMVGGTANEQVLGRMSKMLSSDDSKEAQQVAAMDEEEATLLHASMQAEAEMKRRRRRVADTLNLAIQAQANSLCMQKTSL